MKNKTAPQPLPELSRPLRADHVPLGGMKEHIVAAPAERAALAARFGLEDLARLEAFLDIDRAQDGMFSVKGRIEAQITQSCVVTLEPVISEIHEPVRVLFAPPNLVKNKKDGGVSDIAEDDDLEPIENGRIDLGELVAQILAGAIDPYPRKAGV